MARNVFKCFAPTSLLVFAKGPCVLIGCIFKAQAVYNALSLHFILAQNLKISQMEKTGVLSDPGREIDLPDHQEYVRAFESVRASLVAQTVKRLSAMQEMWVRSLGWKDPLEKEMANPLQYSCLENSMDGGAWQATVHGAPKNPIQLSA